MHSSYMPVVELQDGMVLGSASWLDAIARDADLAYGFAHRPLGLLSQSWFIPPGQGEYTIWEGVTVYDGCHVNLKFSAWVSVPTGGHVTLQLYYSDAWHDFKVDANAGSHWFDDAEDVSGLLSLDISAHYAAGDVVRARLICEGDGASAVTSGHVYWAGLGGVSFEWPDGTPLTWPSWPTWTTASAHSAADFNTIRSAAEYLKRCAEQPVIGTEKGLAYHSQGGSGDEQELFRWAFRLGGQQELHLTVTTDECVDAGDCIKVYIEDYQYPHGPSGASRLATLATYTTNAAQTLNADLSGYTVGTYYCISVNRIRTTTSPTAEVTSCYLRDLAGVTRTTTPGTFAYKDRPAATGDGSVDELADDLEAMKPVDTAASPLWYEHVFATIRGMNQEHYQVSPGTQHYHYDTHHWGLGHLYDYIYWVGAGRIISADGANVETLSDSSPAGQVQVVEARQFTWLAKGDRYTAEDAGSNQLLTIFEHWEA